MDISLLSLSTIWGGAECHTVRLAQELQRRRHRVRLVTFGESAYDGLAEEVSVHRLDMPNRDAASLESVGIRRWLRLLRTVSASVGVMVKSSVNTGSWRLDCAARLAFPRYLSIEHTLPNPLPPRTSRRRWGVIPGLALWWYRLYWKRRLRSIAPQLVVSVSNAVRERLITVCGFPARKVHTVHNGTDTDHFVPDAQTRAIQRQAWSFPEGAIVFGVVGRLSPEKGPDRAIEQFGRLCASSPHRDLRLVLVGDGPERPNLEAAIRRWGVADRVLLTGFSQQPQRVYNGFDYLVIPSHYEGLPLALLEAMACGCPPIAFGVGGIPEVLSRQGMGWLVPPGEGAALLAAMAEAAELGPGEARDRMGRRARAHVCAHFNAQVQYAKLCELIEQTTN